MEIGRIILRYPIEYDYKFIFVLGWSYKKYFTAINLINKTLPSMCG